MVPFERLQEVYYPNAPGGCGAPSNYSLYCDSAPHSEWLRSYGSFTYDAFGFGTAPYVGPITFTKNGFTSIMSFNGTDLEEQITYPNGVPTPTLDLITIDKVLISRGTAPFGGTTIAVNATNHGTNETAEVTFGVIPQNANGFFPGTSDNILAGHSVVVNFTTWVGTIPTVGSMVKISVAGDICYGEICAPYRHFMVVPVVSASAVPKASA